MNRERLTTSFQEKVKIIFKDELCFAFIFGSFAKKKEKETSDIDMFVCTGEDPSSQQQREFFNLYMDLHNEYGCIPDDEFPGEVVSLPFLMESIDYIENWTPHKSIETYREFEAIFWTAVLAERKMAVIDEINVLSDLVTRCDNLVKKWKRIINTKTNEMDLDKYSLLEILTREGYQFMEQHRLVTEGIYIV